MMNELETHSQPRGRLRAEPCVQSSVHSQVAKCLIVSTSDPKRAMVSLAAHDAGWDTIVCANEQSAMAAIQRARFQIAWVDLESPSAPSEFRDCCEAIAALPQVLQVVCGHENDIQEEIWARQLGVWLYLPGVSLEHAPGIVELFEQAQTVAGGVRTPR